MPDGIFVYKYVYKCERYTNMYSNIIIIAAPKALSG